MNRVDPETDDDLDSAADGVDGDGAAGFTKVTL